MPNIRERLRGLNGLRDEAGKFTKAQSYYVHDAYLKPFRCGNCNHYQAEGKCNIVSAEGPPGDGVISREGACALYNARPPRITTLQWLWGRAEREGVAPERMRATAFMLTYASLDEEPPEELQEKAFLSVETVDRLTPT